MQAEPTRYLYRFEHDAFDAARATLKGRGYRLRAALFTPCEVLRARAPGTGARPGPDTPCS